MTNVPFWGPDFATLQAEDPEIAGILLSELDRARNGLQLIASENFTSPAVLAALGSTLSNKYAEGYPGRRYYGGCSEVDKAEIIGIERAKELFGADHANLQPHSGASANIAVYGAFVKPGEKILAMSLPHGGHLTHGTKVSFSGKWFEAVHYGVDKTTEDIDYDQVRDLAREHQPKMIICGGSAIPRLIDFAAFREIYHQSDLRGAAQPTTADWGLSFLLPGFVESHMHLFPGAADRDKEPILELVRFLADQRGPDAAIDALTAVIDSGATSPEWVTTGRRSSSSSCSRRSRW